MKKLLFTLMFSIAIPAITPAGAQTSQQPPAQAPALDPGQCGAGGMGCTPAEVRKWMEKGIDLVNLSSADLSQYAYACAQHPEWKHECETDPGKILRRLGITDD